MSTAVRRVPQLALTLVAAASLALAAAPAVAEATRKVERTFPAAAGSTLVVRNLAGNVTVARAGGNEIRVVATIHAEGESSADSERLAGRLDVAFDDAAGKLTVHAKYPLDSYRKYSYPRRAESESLPWFLQWLDVGSVNSRFDGVPVRIVSQRSSGAPTLFADFRVEVPDGVAVSVQEMLGEIRAAGLAGDFKGELGSGYVEARDGRGAAAVETGSGDVTIASRAGDVRVETGSGDVRLERVDGGRVYVETGSGDVRLVAVSGGLSLETGSGDIVADGLTAGDALAAETGSGDIRLAGDLSAVRRIDVSTGSGDVTLAASHGPDLRLAISTGSGDITVDLPGARLKRNDRHDVRVEIGAASGTGDISTGSGDVVLRQGR